jgi:hypothetical protein
MRSCVSPNGSPPTLRSTATPNAYRRPSASRRSPSSSCVPFVAAEVRRPRAILEVPGNAAASLRRGFVAAAKLSSTDEVVNALAAVAGRVSGPSSRQSFGLPLRSDGRV